MSSRLVLVVAALLLAANIGFLIASASRADSSAAGKYQLVVDSGRMYLFDTTNGTVWQRLEYREGGMTVKDEWQPLKIATPKSPANALILQKLK